MSLELGGTNKNISYLNLQKSGEEADNDPAQEQHCSVSIKFRTPFLAKQDEYLCAVTRFSVPLSQVPSIKGMRFEVKRHMTDMSATGLNADGSPISELLPCVQDGQEQDRTIIDVGDCYTFNGFLRKIEEALKNTFIEANYTEVGQDIDGQPSYLAVADVVEFNANRAHRLSERIKMTITPDFRFRVWICNDGYGDDLMVQMSRGMFHMTQFNVSPNALGPYKTHINHTFIGGPLNHASPKIRDSQEGSLAVNVAGTSGYVPRTDQRLNWQGRIQNEEAFLVGVLEGENMTYGVTEVPLARRWTVHTAQMSCADYNRCREIVFVSDMAVKSEGNTSGGYKRFLCDYQITDNTRFSYQVGDFQNSDPYGPATSHYLPSSSTLTETLPSHRIYQSQNASAGRWQDLTLPVALYEVEVRARVRCWDYETSKYVMEDIPLPAGSQYSVKLIFVSKKNFFDAAVSQTDRYHK